MAPHTWLGISASEFVLFSGRKKATFLRAGGIHFQTGTEVIDSRGRSPVKPVPLALNSAVSQVLTIPVLASGPNAKTTCPWLRGQPPSLPPSLSLSPALHPKLPGLKISLVCGLVGTKKGEFQRRAGKGFKKYRGGERRRDRRERR